MKVLYHANCTDGMGAALAVWLAYGDLGIEYIPVQYGQPVPRRVEGQEVFIVDFSYKKDEMFELSRIANYVTILDHHESAERELNAVKNVPNILTRFNMAKSGAVLAWEYFHTVDIPRLLLHVQDRDLWKFDLPDTKAVVAALSLYPDFRTWKRFIDDPKLIYMDLIPNGNAIIKYLKQQSEKIIETGPIEFKMKHCDQVNVPVYNLQGFMISDTLSMALDKYPDAPYAVSYFDLPAKGIRVYSLRSRKGSDVNVAEIAESAGGGGHKHAAGFTESLI